MAVHDEVEAKRSQQQEVKSNDYSPKDKTPRGRLFLSLASCGLFLVCAVLYFWNAEIAGEEVKGTVLIDSPLASSRIVDPQNRRLTSLPQTVVVKEKKADEKKYAALRVRKRHHYYPEPKDNLFYNKMASLGLERSQKQFRKFLFQEKSLASVFGKRTRFYFNRDSAAYIISGNFAFLHIYKNGGTTVEFMRLKPLKQLWLTHPGIQKRNWLTVVRDPIDRFLSAWAECGYRQKKGMKGFGSLGKLINETYDFRIWSFLKATNRTIGRIGGCLRHAYPQANFMMTPNGTIDEHVKVVGDLSELKHMVEDIGRFRHWNDTKQSKMNSASENSIKAKHFPSNRSLLSDGTILELCKFLQLDYYLFDYDPPPICIADGGPLEFLN